MGSAIKLFTTAAILLIGGLMAPQVVHMQGVSLVDESGPPTGVKQVSDDYSRVEPAQQLSACYNIRKQKMNKRKKRGRWEVLINIVWFVGQPISNTGLLQTVWKRSQTHEG